MYRNVCILIQSVEKLWSLNFRLHMWSFWCSSFYLNRLTETVPVEVGSNFASFSVFTWSWEKLPQKQICTNHSSVSDSYKRAASQKCYKFSISSPLQLVLLNYNHMFSCQSAAITMQQALYRIQQYSFRCNSHWRQREICPSQHYCFWFPCKDLQTFPIHCIERYFIICKQCQADGFCSSFSNLAKHAGKCS